MRGDDRPHLSEMPAAARALLERETPLVRDAIGRAFAEALTIAGPQAQVENDALSVTAQLAATAVAEFVARLARSKGVAAEVAWVGAIVDLQFRTIAILTDPTAHAGETVQ